MFPPLRCSNAVIAADRRRPGASRPPGGPDWASAVYVRPLPTSPNPGPDGPACRRLNCLRTPPHPPAPPASASARLLPPSARSARPPRPLSVSVARSFARRRTRRQGLRKNGKVTPPFVCGPTGAQAAAGANVGAGTITLWPQPRWLHLNGRRTDLGLHHFTRSGPRLRTMTAVGGHVRGGPTFVWFLGVGVIRGTHVGAWGGGGVGGGGGPLCMGEGLVGGTSLCGFFCMQLARGARQDFGRRVPSVFCLFLSPPAARPPRDCRSGTGQVYRLCRPVVWVGIAGGFGGTTRRLCVGIARGSCPPLSG
jgi:hypothetical protein